MKARYRNDDPPEDFDPSCSNCSRVHKKGSKASLRCLDDIQAQNEAEYRHSIQCWSCEKIKAEGSYFCIEHQHEAARLSYYEGGIVDED